MSSGSVLSRAVGNRGDARGVRVSELAGMIECTLLLDRDLAQCATLGVVLFFAQAASS